METKKDVQQDIKQFILENDIMPKIRAALEEIAVGQGYSVFEGLQNGECTLRLTYDGVNMHVSRLEKLTPVEVKLPPSLIASDEALPKETPPGPMPEDVAFSEKQPTETSEQSSSETVTDERRARRRGKRAQEIE